MFLFGAECMHWRQGRPVGVYSKPGDTIPDGGTTARDVAEAREAMGIDWFRYRSATQEWNDLREAIPPAYTQYLGEQLLAALQTNGAADQTTGL